VDGYVPTPPNNHNSDAIESWDGTAWSEVAELNTPRRASGAFGTTTAGIVAGGYVARCKMVMLNLGMVLLGQRLLI
jgi:hypothetical protein